MQWTMTAMTAMTATIRWSAISFYICVAWMQIERLAQQRPEELAKIMPHTSLLKMLMLCSEIEVEAAHCSGSSLNPSQGAGPATQSWLSQHAQNDDLNNFFVSKVCFLMSAICSHPRFVF
jgi:hypothetical protein